MSDTASVRKMRKIPAIVVDRSSGSGRRLLIGLLLGVVIALGGAVLLTLGAQHGPEVIVPGARAGLPPYVVASVVLGALLGLALGWCYKRSVTPRIEVVEIELPPPSLRLQLSRSSALVRRGDHG